VSYHFDIRLVASCCVLFLVLGNTDDLGYGDRVEVAEGLEQTQSVKFAKIAWTMELDETSASHQPRSSPPNETPQIKHPSPRIIRPPKRVQQPDITYICDGTLGELAVPLVLDLCDLAALVEDVDDR
jgi:hypothetical protein